jgi:phosphoglucosamine mutase
MRLKLFGTDGIRGRAGEFPLDATAIRAIGQAAGEKLQGSVLLGEDTRISSPWIRDLLTEGLQRANASAEDAGVIPTPAIALLTRSAGFAGGLMISASHNPFDDNGIKIFSRNGTKLSDEAEAAIEKRVFELLESSGELVGMRGLPGEYTFKPNDTQWPKRYQQELAAHFPPGEWLRGQRIVLDCANGAMSEVAPAMLKRLGADVEVLFATPNGRNINAGCGAVHLEALSTAMKNTTANFGVAFDGDGDRSLFVSADGRHIDGDAVLMMMARRLKADAVVGTSMTNFSLEKILRLEGIALARVDVGDRYIFEEMQRRRSERVIGGEPSGHIIFQDFGLSGDGLLTTLKVAQSVVDSGQTLEELTRDWIASPQLLKGARVQKRVPLEELKSLQAVMGAARKALDDRGRLVVRYSGTEPLLRVMIESDDAARNEVWMKKLLEAIEHDFNGSGRMQHSS